MPCCKIVFKQILHLTNSSEWVINFGKRFTKALHSLAYFSLGSNFTNKLGRGLTLVLETITLNHVFNNNIILCFPEHILCKTNGCHNH